MTFGKDQNAKEESIKAYNKKQILGTYKNPERNHSKYREVHIPIIW